jgi:hypothetical protein
LDESGKLDKRIEDLDEVQLKMTQFHFVAAKELWKNNSPKAQSKLRRQEYFATLLPGIPACRQAGWREIKYLVVAAKNYGRKMLIPEQHL